MRDILIELHVVKSSLANFTRVLIISVLLFELPGRRGDLHTELAAKERCKSKGC
mgnify:CR=1 FL=1